MKIQHISAVTLAVQDMAQSVDFYRKLGLELLYGGEQASSGSCQQALLVSAIELGFGVCE